MNRPHEVLFSLQRLVSDLSLVDRNHHILDSDRAENDIVHSFGVAMLCWYICDEYDIQLNLQLILKYALVHDFVERYAGDVCTYASKESRQKKVELEAAALTRLSDEFKDFPDLVKVMNDYQDSANEEALFVWTVDKMQALVLSELDGWRPHKKVGVTYDHFIEKYAEQLENCSPHLKEILTTLYEYCKTTYYDRPKVS